MCPPDSDPPSRVQLVKKYVNHSRVRLPEGRGGAPRSAVFLDRDGVIVEDTRYLHRIADVQFIAGALESVAAMNKLGFPLVLVTNQAGIGRGYYGWEEFEQVEKYIEQELEKAGGWFDGVWACAYHPQGLADAAASYYRKPSPGMLEAATLELGLDLPNSWLVGDKPCDIEAALKAGLHNAVHVLTGHGSETREEVLRIVREGGTAGCKVHFRDSLQGMVPLLQGGVKGRVA